MLEQYRDNLDLLTPVKERVAGFLQRHERKILFAAHVPVRLVGYGQNAVWAGAAALNLVDARTATIGAMAINVGGAAFTWGMTAFYGKNAESKTGRLVHRAYELACCFDAHPWQTSKYVARRIVDHTIDGVRRVGENLGQEGVPEVFISTTPVITYERKLY